MKHLSSFPSPSFRSPSFRWIAPALGATFALGCAGSATWAQDKSAETKAAESVPIPAALTECAQLRGDAERLLCYDGIVGPKVRGGALPTKAAIASSAASAPAVSPPVLPDASYLDEYWELGADRKRGTFNFSGYRPTYFLPVHVTSHVNESPNSPTPGHAAQLPAYRDVEAKLQVSIRTKVAQGLLLPNADLWFGYTQTSLWQLYNHAESTPFRSTDHEPELTYVVPTPLDLPLGAKLRMTGIGFAHQSNGQTLPQSRSWNRVYALVGAEFGDVALTARFNKRLSESDDDNPDLTSYRGRNDLLAVWTPGFQTVSAQWRTNFDRRGSLQIDWTLPVSSKDPKGLRWYLQFFTGYAETLIDYNFRQNSLGAGVSLLGW